MRQVILRTFHVKGEGFGGLRIQVEDWKFTSIPQARSQGYRLRMLRVFPKWTSCKRTSCTTLYGPKNGNYFKYTLGGPATRISIVLDVGGRLH